MRAWETKHRQAVAVQLYGPPKMGCSTLIKHAGVAVRAPGAATPLPLAASRERPCLGSQDQGARPIGQRGKRGRGVARPAGQNDGTQGRAKQACAFSINGGESLRTAGEQGGAEEHRSTEYTKREKGWIRVLLAGTGTTGTTGDGGSVVAINGGSRQPSSTALRGEEPDEPEHTGETGMLARLVGKGAGCPGPSRAEKVYCAIGKEKIRGGEGGKNAQARP